MSQGDGVGGVIAICAGIALIWWAWDRYEIVERDEMTPTEEALEKIERPTEIYYFSNAESGSKYGIDPNSVTGPRTDRRAWIITDHGDDETIPYRTSKEFTWANCESGGTKILALFRYSPDEPNSPAVSYSYEFDEAETSYYPPDSIGDGIRRAMCAPIYDQK